MAARAMTESLAVLAIARSEVDILPVHRLQRGAAFDVGDAVNPVLFVANPHALHAPAILEGEKAGFPLIVCEKPAAVWQEQIEALQNVKTPVAVCHVYRQTWGMQTLKRMIDAGEFGEIIAIEGRYWQSSTAVSALGGEKRQEWKNDPAISGPTDALFDIGTHWADAALYLAGSAPEAVSVRLSYANAPARHRDTHVHLDMTFPGGMRALGSISKTIHGAPNHFEVNVIGSRKYACWKFLEPDQIEVGVGRERTLIVREDRAHGSGHWPFHGLGWIEGYIEIIRQAVKELSGEKADYPTLEQNLEMVGLLLEGSSESRRS